MVIRSSNLHRSLDNATAGGSMTNTVDWSETMYARENPLKDLEGLSITNEDEVIQSSGQETGDVFHDAAHNQRKKKRLPVVIYTNDMLGYRRKELAQAEEKKIALEDEIVLVLARKKEFTDDRKAFGTTRRNKAMIRDCNKKLDQLYISLASARRNVLIAKDNVKIEECRKAELPNTPIKSFTVSRSQEQRSELEEKKSALEHDKNLLLGKKAKLSVNNTFGMRHINHQRLRKYDEKLNYVDSQIKNIDSEIKRLMTIEQIIQSTIEGEMIVGNAADDQTAEQSQTSRRTESLLSAETTGTEDQSEITPVRPTSTSAADAPAFRLSRWTPVPYNQAARTGTLLGGQSTTARPTTPTSKPTYDLYGSTSAPTTEAPVTKKLDLEKKNAADLCAKLQKQIEQAQELNEQTDNIIEKLERALNT